MSGYLFTKRARFDLREIARFSRMTWGKVQGREYVVGLKDFCQELEETPGLGRPCSKRLAGLMRMEHGSHVLFYRAEGERILIVRILHKRMLPELHSFDEM